MKVVGSLIFSESERTSLFAFGLRQKEKSNPLNISRTLILRNDSILREFSPAIILTFKMKNSFVFAQVSILTNYITEVAVDVIPNLYCSRTYS